MNAREMHYDIKTKLNKVDSQQNYGFRVQELDWALNEAQEIFIKMIAEPRTKTQFGFEKSQRNIDDIREIVVDNEDLTLALATTYYSIYTLPDDYMFPLSYNALASKGNCEDKKMKVYPVQHDDRHEDSPFDKANFEWRETNIEFIEDGIKIYTDGTFTIEKLYLDYIRQPEYIHNAQDAVGGGGYNKLDGTPLAGTEPCELAEHTHREIVDIAVMILTGEMQIPDIQIKQNKLKLSQI